MPGSNFSDVERLKGYATRIPEDKLRELYQRVHGVLPGEALSLGFNARRGYLNTAFSKQPSEHPTKSRQLLQRMFPYEPPVNVTATMPKGVAAYQSEGQVYIPPEGVSNAILAHEYEHARQDISGKPSSLLSRFPVSQGALMLATAAKNAARSVGNIHHHAANEIPAQIAGEVFPQASYQSDNPAVLARQEHDRVANFNENYQPSMTWLHNQAQRHGVFGPTPMAKALGFTGNTPVSTTKLIADNPQWLGTIADHPLPQASAGNRRPKSAASLTLGLSHPAVPKQRPAPDLTGYLK